MLTSQPSFYHLRANADTSRFSAESDGEYHPTSQTNSVATTDSSRRISGHQISLLPIPLGDDHALLTPNIEKSNFDKHTREKATTAELAQFIRNSGPPLYLEAPERKPGFKERFNRLVSKSSSRNLDEQTLVPSRHTVERETIKGKKYRAISVEGLMPGQPSKSTSAIPPIPAVPDQEHHKSLPTRYEDGLHLSLGPKFAIDTPDLDVHPAYRSDRTQPGDETTHDLKNTKRGNCNSPRSKLAPPELAELPPRPSSISSEYSHFPGPLLPDDAKPPGNSLPEDDYTLPGHHAPPNGLPSDNDVTPRKDELPDERPHSDPSPISSSRSRLSRIKARKLRHKSTRPALRPSSPPLDPSPPPSPLPRSPSPYPYEPPLPQIPAWEYQDFRRPERLVVRKPSDNPANVPSPEISPTNPPPGTTQQDIEEGIHILLAEARGPRLGGISTSATFPSTNHTTPVRRVVSADQSVKDLENALRESRAETADARAETNEARAKAMAWKEAYEKKCAVMERTAAGVLGLRNGYKELAGRYDGAVETMRMERVEREREREVERERTEKMQRELKRLERELALR